MIYYRPPLDFLFDADFHAPRISRGEPPVTQYITIEEIKSFYEKRGDNEAKGQAD